ncbi:hypothetical protein [Cohnella sp. 56]|uniref:hypothetical protein n=1 Tax=Cohnella sp. 56 TaxID=3113722 RepID=UPI0030E8FB58
MRAAALLSRGDVSAIRAYVRAKFASLPEAGQADIVADAIARAIRARLPDWPEALKTQVADKLIAACIVAERREVYPADVLGACAGMKVQDEVHAERLLRWLSDRTQIERTLDEILLRTEDGLVWRTDPAFMALTAMRENEAWPATAAAGSTDAHGGMPSAAGAVHAMRPVRRMRQAARLIAVVVLLVVTALSPELGQALDTSGESADSRLTASCTNDADPAPMYALETAPFAFAPFDAAAVKSYLVGRESVLAEEPYFGAIVESARKHNIDPLLLLAVTGQEQGFVPKTAKQASRIANNPFNVYHSWQEYNTSIHDSSDIAAKLLAKLRAGIPAGEEPFAWLNRTYAEDAGWADGVRALYAKLSGLGRPQEGGGVA